MRRKIWKQVIAWMLIIAIVGGYGNTAMAAGVGDVGQLAEGEEGGLSGESGSEAAEETGELGSAGESDSTEETDNAGGTGDTEQELTEAPDQTENPADSLPVAPEYEYLEVKSPFDYLQENGEDAGFSFFSRQEYTDSFGSQIEDATAKELYDRMVEVYFANKGTGISGEIALEHGTAFVGQFNDSYQLVQDENYKEAVTEFGTCFNLALSAFYMDYPSVFWLHGMAITFRFSRINTAGSENVKISAVQFSPKEYYEGASGQITSYDAAVQDVKEEIESRIAHPGNRYETVQKIHDYLCETLSYDTAAGNDLSSSYYNYAHTSSTAFLGYNGKKEVVCEGYAKAFKVLCDQWNIPCVLVVGNAGNPGGTQGPHMWNYVQMEDGKWYAVDVTWDDQVYGMRTEYFLAGSTTGGFHATFSEEHLENMNILEGAAAPFVYPVLAEHAYENVYRGTIATDENAGKWLYLSDLDAGACLTDAEYLELLEKNASEAPFAGILLERDRNAEGEQSYQISKAIVNKAAGLLSADGILEFDFWDQNTEGAKTLTQWRLYSPQEMDEEAADINGKITAGKAGDKWTLSLSAVDLPAESYAVSYVSPDLKEPYYSLWTAAGEEIPIYFYGPAEENGERPLAAFGGYSYLPAEGNDEGTGILSIASEGIVTPTQELAAGVSYTAETSLYDWRLEYGYTYAADGTETGGRVAAFVTEADLTAALEGLSLAEGTNIRIRYEGEEQPAVIPADLLEVCARKGLNLEYSRWEEETETLHTWRFEGLEAVQTFQDYVLYVEIASEGVTEVENILEGTYIQIAPSGKLPSCDSAELTIVREGISLPFVGTDVVSQWQLDGSSLTYIGEAGLDPEGNWVCLNLTEANGAYVLSKQFAYGWTVITEDGEERIVYISDGTGERLTGWQMIDGAKCYFDENGYLYQGPAQINGIWYLFGSYIEGNPGLMFGYQEYGENAYYTDVRGVLQKGWQKIENIWHYFDLDTCQEQASTQEGYWVTITETQKRYYFYANAYLLTGWRGIDGFTYYLEADGSVKTGWLQYGGYWYYFDAEGKMRTGYIEVMEGGVLEHYFIAYNGVRLTGWQKYGNTWHYFDPQNGKEIASNNTRGFWYVMDGETYFFSGNSWLATGFQYIDGAWYCFAPDGKMYLGTQWFGGNSYHFNEDGTMGMGLFTDGGKTYYANGNGILYHGWQKIDGVWRFFDQTTGEETSCTIASDYWGYVDGVKSYYFINGYWLATGFQYVEDKLYYFNGNGELQTGFFQVGAYTYYGEPEGENRGVLAVGFKEIDGETYCFAPGYTMYTGWQRLDGTWCYFDTDTETLGQQREVTPLGDGWYEADGDRYYFLYDYYLLTGWQNIGGYTYYFDPATGKMTAGTALQIGWYYYYFNEEGKMQTNCIVDGYGYASGGNRVNGWQYIQNSWHYFDTVTWQLHETTPLGDNWYQMDGQKYYFIYGWYLATNWQYIAGHYYYFEPQTGAMRTGILKNGTSWNYFGADGTLQYGWIEDEEGTYYANSAGALVSGWQKIENIWYFFDPQTRLQDKDAYVADDYFAYAGGNTYYLYEGYYPVTGWAYIQENWHYFDPATGIMKTGLFQVGYTWYYMDEKGIPKTGWQTSEGRKYYCSGAYGQVLTGFQYIDGSYYYFNSDGVMQRYWQQINGYHYYFGSDGRMQTGFIRAFGTTYYCYSNGIMATGLQYIDGAYYYFDSFGVMQTGWQKIGAATYYFQESRQGAMATGLTQIDGETYYFGVYGNLQTGWQWITNRYRFFDTETGKEIPVAVGADYWATVGDKRCYFANGTTPLSGFQYINGSYYYFDPYCFLQTGEFSPNGLYYRAREDGRLYWNEFYTETDPETGAERTYYYGSGLYRVSGWNTIKGSWYYFDVPSGVMQTGFTDINGYKYYFGESGSKRGQLQTGAIYIGGRLTYYSGGAWELQSGWQYVEGDWHYFDPVSKENVPVTREDNWITKNGEKFYFINGWYLATGFQYINGNYYYFDGSGVMQTGEFSPNGYYYRAREDGRLYWNEFYTETDPETDVSKTCYYGSGLYRVSGWNAIDGNWYYFDADGVRKEGGRRNIDGYDYYFDGEGRLKLGLFQAEDDKIYYTGGGWNLLSGWYYVGSELYYFDETTKEAVDYTMSGNWATLRGERYYFWYGYNLATGFQYIDGAYYYFNAKGVLQTGDYVVGQTWYRSNADGTLYTGSYVKDGKEYYYSNGQRYTGWLTLEGERYFYNANGEKRFGKVWLNNVYYYFDPDTGALQTGLIELPEKDEDGNPVYYYTGGYEYLQSGWHKLDGQWYYFASDTKKSVLVVQKENWVTMEGKQYYFIYGWYLATGFQYLDNRYYYFDGTGALQEEGSFSVGGYWYRAKADNSLCLNELYTDPESKKSYYYGSGLYRVSGWVYLDNAWHYFDTDGTMATGWKTVNGYTYYFRENGARAEGYQEIGGEHYYFGGGGYRLTGWQWLGDRYHYFEPETGKEAETRIGVDYWATVGGETCYFSNGTTPVSGFQYIHGKYYYFNAQGFMQKGSFSPNGYWYQSDETGALKLNEFYTDAEGNTYYYNSGLWRVSGWNYIEGSWYYFAADGIMQKGFTDINGYKYYLGTDGRLQTGKINVNGELTYYSGGAWELQSGWQNFDGEWHYFDSVTKENIPVSRENNWITLEGKTYYFIYGWYLATGFQYIDGSWYYFDGTGVLQKGWLYVNGTSYYMDPETGRAYNGFKDFDGKTRYFNVYGNMHTGWLTLYSGEEAGTYYFNTLGTMSRGITYIGNTRYLFDMQGRLVTTRVTLEDGITYYANANGTLKNGLVWESDGYHYYIGGVPQSGMQKVNGVYYYFNRETGAMQTGWVTEEKDGATRKYWFASNGIRVSGWQYLDQQWYYFDPVNGESRDAVPAADLGQNWYRMDGKEYYFIYGWYLATGFQWINGRYYYFDGTGALQKGTLTVGGYRYQTEENGAVLQNQFYFDSKDGNTYYYGSGLYRVSGWNAIEGSWYYFNAAGVLQRGFTDINGYKYYLGSDGKLQTGKIYVDGTLTYYSGGAWELQSGWQKIDGSWYFFDPDTKESIELEREGNWVTRGTEKYYFIYDWYLATGFQYIDGFWYYFNGNGLLMTGDYAVGATRYRSDENGRLYTGSYLEDGKEYYYSVGQRVRGWQNLDGKTYYYNEAGEKQFGKVLLGGVYYYFDPVTGELRTGLIELQEENGTTSYYYTGGTSYLQSGWQKVQNQWYYFASDTKKSIPVTQTDNWVTMEGKDYYLIYGWYLATGFQWIDGRYYYFDGTGALQKGSFTVGSYWYQTEEDGKLLQNQFYKDPESENMYYYGSGFWRVSGWNYIEGNWYYFDATGVRQTGITRLNGYLYYLDEEGRLQTGLIETADGTYYSGGGWELQSGWQKINGEWYYFDPVTRKSVELTENGNWVTKGTEKYYFIYGWYLATGFQYLDGNWYYFGTDGAVKTGDYTVNGVQYRSNPDGTLYTTSREQAPYEEAYYDNGRRISGWLVLDGKKYYYNAQGEKQHGKVWLGGVYYYFDETTGELRTGLIQVNGTDICYYTGGYEYLQSGWHKINDEWKYFSADTKESIPVEWDGSWALMEGEKYYFINPWTLAAGWQYLENSWHYFDGKGVLQRGWFSLGANRYYSDPETGAACNGFKTFGDKTCYFDTYGTMYRGWLTLYSGEQAGTYYFDGSGSMCTGVTRIGYYSYLFDTQGRLVTTETVIDGVTYYAAGNGILRSGLSWENGGYYYYLSGLRQTGLQEIGGNYYYFDSDTGCMKTGWVTEEQDGVEKTWWFAGNGVRVTGWQWIENEMYYFNSAGVLQKGWFDVGASHCYGDPENGRLGYGLQKIGEDTYYFNRYGIALEGFQYIDGWRYFKNYKMQTGVVQIGNVSYFFDANGIRQTGIVTWTEDNQEYEYCLDGNGIVQKGWRYVNGGWNYYSSQTGRKMEAEVIPSSELKEDLSAYCRWYRVTENGKENWYCIYANSYALTGLVTLGNYRYYFDANGALYKGTFTVGGISYYADEETGAIPVAGVFYTDEETGDIYFYNTYGQMVKGWMYYQGQSYYFSNVTGAAYRSGWYYVDNRLYLFSPLGAVQYQPVLTGLNNINYQTIELTWNPAKEAEEYEIQYAKTSDFSDAQEKLVSGDASKVQIDELEENTLYYVRYRYKMADEILHTVEGKDDEALYSEYSPVYTITVQGETVPYYGAASVQSCEVVTDAASETTYGIRMTVNVTGRLRSDDASYYVARMDTYYGSLLEAPLYEISKDDGIKSEDGRSYQFTFTMPMENVNEDVMNKYALAVKTGGSYQIISPGSFVSNPEYVAEYKTAYYVADSKKGIQGASTAYSKDLGTKQTLLNLDLKDVLKAGPGGGVVEYTYKGRTYYFSDLESLRGTVTEYNNGKFGNNISVTLVILASYRTDHRIELIHPSARIGSSAKYYTLDSATLNGQQLYEAMFSYLGEVFGKDDCYVSNWILGNEVDSCNAWNYTGYLSFAEYMRCYAASFRQLYYGVKKTRASSRVFISLDNAWNRAVAGYTGKQVMDTFASYIYAENSDIEWNVAFHPYSAPLTRTDFWNDYSNTTESWGTPFISMRNLHVLTDYLSYLESAYGKDAGSIRVILSEQGWTSSGYGEYNQALAIALGYYIAEFNPRVDAFIIRAEVDDWEEMCAGLYMGLRNYGVDTKKMSYYVYKYMDTPRASHEGDDWNLALKDYDADSLGFSSDDNRQRFKDTQSMLLNWNWAAWVPGYDESKLNSMPYAYSEFNP